MKHTIILLAICAMLVGCSVDGGTPITKSFNTTGSYTAIDVSNAFSVSVSDQATDVQVTVGEKVMGKLKVEVKDGTLHIGFNKSPLFYIGTAQAVIPAGIALHEVNLSGASEFVGNLSGDEVEIELSGASKYNGNVDANTVDIDLSGASEATVRSTCQTTLSLDLSGASNLYAFKLTANDVTGQLSGASNAEVTCCNSLRADLSGASSITYDTPNATCTPTVNCTASGSSTVSAR